MKYIVLIMFWAFSIENAEAPYKDFSYYGEQDHY